MVSPDIEPKSVNPGAYGSRRPRCKSPASVIALAHLADMMLRVELKPEPTDEIKHNAVDPHG
jgi:hypothetical protein